MMGEQTVRHAIERWRPMTWRGIISRVGWAVLVALVAVVAATR